jgi:hypothetical protein
MTPPPSLTLAGSLGFLRRRNLNDLSLKGYLRHDASRLFAFDVSDDVLSGIDTPRALPDENPNARQLSRSGFPWFRR